MKRFTALLLAIFCFCLYSHAGSTIGGKPEERYISGGQVGSTNAAPLPGVPTSFTHQTSNGRTYTSIQKGQLNKYRIRPRIFNEQAESSREIQGVVSSNNIVGQVFRASHDNINGINVTLESAASEVLDTFESYADDAALQVVWTNTSALMPALLSTTIAYEGSKSMLMEVGANAAVDDEIYTVIAATDFTGYTGNFWMYANKEYKDVQMRVFIRDALGNSSSAEIFTGDKDEWFKYAFPVDFFVADDVTPAALTNIVQIGFRVDKTKPDGLVYFDYLFSVPAPGSVGLKLWDMGATKPVAGVAAIDDGTQYTELGDRGMNGGIVVAEVEVDLQGGLHLYDALKFVAGVALEIPDNTLLTEDNYYALTMNYIDTDVSVYGPNSAYSNDYYTSGYAFTAPDEATAITAVGPYSDCMFIIFSTQDVYLRAFIRKYNAEPGVNSTEYGQLEDSNMLSTITRGASRPSQTVALNYTDTRPFLEKGGKVEIGHSDDFEDNVSSVTIDYGWLYEPKQPHN